MTPFEQPARPLILHVIPTFAVGGVQRRFAQIANASGHIFRHAVMALDGRYEANCLLEPQAGVAFASRESTRGTLLDRIWRYGARLSCIQPDVLVTYNWGAIEWGAASRFAGVTNIHIEDGFGPDEVDRQLQRRVIFRRLALQRSHAVVVPSRTLYNLVRDVWRLPSDICRYIPNGIDVPEPGSIAKLNRASIGAPEDSLVVGWVGALRPEKNISRLLRAFAKLPENAVLVLVGEGPERPAIEAEIAALGIGARVILLGLRADVASLMPLFDVISLSSDTEQMPIALLEGMAAALPIATVEVGDVRTMLSSENQPSSPAGRNRTRSGSTNTRQRYGPSAQCWRREQGTPPPQFPAPII